MQQQRPPHSAPLSWLATARGVCSLVFVGLLAAGITADDDVPLHDATRIHFTSVEEAAKVLEQKDTFVLQMGPIERQLRLRADGAVALQDYLEFTRQQALAWTEDEVALVSEAVSALRPKLARLKPVWPAAIDLVKTTGREEGNAPHCRGNAIVLPTGSLQRDSSALQALLAHELFHILTRQSPTLKSQLYEIINFHSVEPITLPKIWHDRRITNPDAPRIDCVISLQHEQSVLHVTPILLTKQSSYESAGDRSLFRELMFRLMPVESQGSRWIATQAASEGQCWRPEELPDYAAKVGRNTSYIIHPEEILADNFVLLITDQPDVPDPWVVERLSETLWRPLAGVP